jgi:hypothetical protein
MEKERGVSLIMTFFVMTTILSVILSVSIILYSEIKVTRNMGGSAISFYAADTGVEKVLYYDRNVLSPGASRGFCSIFNNCHNDPDLTALNVDHSAYCNDTKKESLAPLDQDGQTVDGCDEKLCNNCRITFQTNLNADTQNTVVATLSPSADEKNIDLKIVSTGSYKGVKRAVSITSSKESAGKTMVVMGYACPISTEQGKEIAISAYAKIGVSTGESIASVSATIKRVEDGIEIEVGEPKELSLESGDLNEGSYFLPDNWSTNEPGVYNVYITATSTNDSNKLTVLATCQ